MAFGDIRGTKTGNATSVTASNACATGTNFAVSVGDIIVAAFAEQTSITVTACADNLTNTYTAFGPGADAGTVTGRAFWTRVTNPGTISSLTFTATASSNNYACAAVGFEGPFATSPLDAQPAGILNDLTTPYTCPPTGVLAQADEKIVNVIVHNGNPTFTATAPNLKAIDVATATILKVAIGHQTVTSTASVTPAWTASATPTAAGNDTVSFKKVTPTQGDGAAGGIAGATGGGGTINTTPGTAGGVAAATAVGVAASIYSAEADQFFARTTGLTDERKELIDTYISALVAGGVWAKLQAHYLFAAPDAATAVVNLKSSSFPGTVNGSPTFVVDVGFAGTVAGATTHFIDTGYNPFVHGAQDNQHISLWNSTNQSQGYAAMGVASASTLLQIWPKYIDNKSYYFCNTGGNGNIAVGDPRGLHITTSTGIGGQVAYFNGVSSGTIAGTTDVPPNFNIYVLAYNNVGGALGSTFQLRSASIGTRLTAAEAGAFFDAQYAFLAALVGNVYSSVGSASGVAAASAEGRSIVAAATGGGGDWTAVYSRSAGDKIQNPGWAGYTLVSVIPLAAFSQTGGSSIRITFQCPFSGEGSEYSAFYIGNGGGADSIDFVGTPTRIFVGGSGTITMPLDGSGFGTVVSDEIAFVKDGVNPLVIAGQLQNASADTISYFPPVTGSEMHYKGALDAATIDKSGYANISGSGILAVLKIELFIAVAGGVAGVGGASAVGAIGVPSAEGAGSAIGVGAAAASAAAITAGASSSPGVGAAAAVGGKLATTSGAATGVGSATASSSAAAYVSGVGSAPGVGTAAAIGGKIATASGSAVGLGIAAGSSSAAAFGSGVGTASGVGFAVATGFSHSAAAVGTAAGLGAAAATAQKIAAAVSAVVGTGAATATSGAIKAAAGAASGIGSATATGFEAAVVFEESAGQANAIGTASGTGFGIQPSATPGDRVTELPFSPRSGSLPASMRGAAVAGSRRIAAVAGHNRIAIVPRRDRAA